MINSRIIIRQRALPPSKLSTIPLSNPKHFEDIPVVKNEWYILGSLPKLLKQKAGYHEFYADLHREYGDIVRFSLMGTQCVSITRPDNIKEVYLTNQAAPLRETLIPWMQYRKDKGISLGVAMQLSQFDQNEEEWRKFRRPIAKLLNPELVASYVPRIAKIALSLAETLRLTNQKDLKVVVDAFTVKE